MPGLPSGPLLRLNQERDDFREGTALTTISPIVTTAMVILALAGVWHLVNQPLRSARTLRQRCSKELHHLKGLITSRHLILSHLLDVIPRSQERSVNRRKLRSQLHQAEKGLEMVDPDNPVPATLRAMEDLEQCLMLVVFDMRLSLDSLETDAPVQAFQGCLDGLEKVSEEIRDSASTYNAAAITYATFVDDSFVARRVFTRDFEIIDLEPQFSSITDDSSGVSSDRVAS